MKNKLTDLNDHLFAQLERLGDEGLSEEELAREVGRTKAITDVSKSIISNATLVLEAEKFKQDSGLTAKSQMPKMLSGQ